MADHHFTPPVATRGIQLPLIGSLPRVSPVLPTEPKGVVYTKRWVVERTFAWLGRCRRNSKDYERRTDSSESMLRVSALHLMLKRLKPSKVYPPFRYRVAA